MKLLPKLNLQAEPRDLQSSITFPAFSYEIINFVFLAFTLKAFALMLLSKLLDSLSIPHV